MKIFYYPVFISLILLVSCAGQRNKILFHPGSAHEGEQTLNYETWIIIEAQRNDIPEWVNIYLDAENDHQKIENLDKFSGKYVFTGENRGDNINILNQWANSFSVTFDFPRLVAHRVEKKLISSASLYPDDEYGEYFVSLIRRIFDSEFSGAVKEETFWVKRRLISVNDDNEDEEEFRITDIPVGSERYEIFILISTEKESLQKQIREIMANVRSNVSVTRDQAAAINRVQANFFERF